MGMEGTMPPEMFLMFSANEEEIAKMVSDLTHPTAGKIIAFLEKFLALPDDDRLVLLEACDFYNPREAGKYCQDTAKLENLVRRLSAQCDVPLGENYYRFKRPTYIAELMEKGRQGWITAANAVKSVRKHIGGDTLDCHDAMHMFGGWPAAAKLFKQEENLFYQEPSRYRSDPNLLQDPACRSVMHAGQEEIRISIVRSDRDMTNLERMMAKEEWIVMTVVENRRPRSVSTIPSFIGFAGLTSSLYGFFPEEGEGELEKKIVRVLAKKRIFGRPMNIIKKYFTLRGGAPVIHDADAAATRHAGSYGLDEVGRFVWGHRMCRIASHEWPKDPLSFVQEYHLSYMLCLRKDFVKKVGTRQLMTTV
jgi:hypothetical protein